MRLATLTKHFFSWFTSKHTLFISFSSNPITAAIPPSPSGTADCINLDLSVTRSKASLKEIVSEATNAAYSPKECPARQIGKLIN